MTPACLKTEACAEKPQVSLSGDFLYHPGLLLLYQLAFLFIKKEKKKKGLSLFSYYGLFSLSVVETWDLFSLGFCLAGCGFVVVV